MIHVVSGYMRTGTSAMMAALHMGGLDAAWDESRNQDLNRRFSDDWYKMNPGGFYELEHWRFSRLDFADRYAGRLVKCLHGALTALPAHEYRIVFMLRDFEEIRQSLEAASRRRNGWMIPRDQKEYDQLMKRALDVVAVRTDMEVRCVYFRDLIEDPDNVFGQLYDDGWPIDVGAATAKIDPALYRFRLEGLEVGV